MRAVIQRVGMARVTVENIVMGSIDQGLLILLGVTGTDSEAHAATLAAKIAKLRIFQDEAGKMNLSVRDAGGAALVVSQFTLYADCSHGNRPSFTPAAPPRQAEALYEFFCLELAEQGLRVEKGVFGASMAVDLLNDGPVTICLDTADLRVG